MAQHLPGRPRQDDDSDAREKLLAAARELFLKRPYAEVTTRQIAELAGVNKALINYYFTGKKALFAAVLTDVTGPVIAQLMRARQQGELSLDGIARRFLEVMAAHPDFPRLLMKIMLGSDDQLREQVLHKVIKRAANEIRGLIDNLQKAGQLDPALDPKLLTITIQTLMVAPVLLRPILEQVHDITLDQATLTRLAEQNGRLINQLLEAPAAE